MNEDAVNPEQFGPFLPQGLAPTSPISPIKQRHDGAQSVVKREYARDQGFMRHRNIPYPPQPAKRVTPHQRHLN